MSLFNSGLFTMRKVLESVARNSNADLRLEVPDAANPLPSRAHLSRPSQAAASEIASYIAQMTAEMAGMAGAARLEMLAYFLDMARNEAEMQSRAPSPETRCQSR